MDTKKIEITSNVFYYISRKLEDEFKLGYVNNIQSIDFDTIKIKIHRKQTKELIINTKTMYLPTVKVPVMEKSLEFIRFLKRKLDNERIQEIKQHTNNKLIYFKLDNYYLIFEFFSSSNIILTDLDFIVISARRYEKWKDRKIIRKEKYDFPNCEDIKEKNINDLLKEVNTLEDKSFFTSFIKNYNIAPYYLEEVKNKVDINNKEAYIEQIKELYNIDLNQIKIETINKNDKKLIVCQKKDEEDKEDEKKIESNDFWKPLEKMFLNKKTTKKTNVKNKKLKKVEKILDIQKKTKDEFEKKIEDNKKEAELIYQNYQLIETINKQINLAVNKDIKALEIKNKINDYFKNKDLKIRIEKIDLKTKKYILNLND